MRDYVKSGKSKYCNISREIFLKDIGSRIKHLREQKKWTQEMLAQEAQINDKYVYEIENGKKCMSIWILAKISIALGVNIEYFLLDKNDAVK